MIDKNKLKKFILYFSYLFFSSFILVEIASRFLLPQPIRTTSTKLHEDGLLTNKNSGSARHSYYGIKPIKYKFGNFYTRISDSQKSFDQNYKTNNLCNLLILGDSYSFGWLMSDSNYFVDKLQINLKKKYDNDVLIHNAGMGGAALSYYEAFTKKFKNEIINFDGIVIFVNSGDISDSESNTNFNSYSFSKSTQSRIIYLKKLIDNKYYSKIHNFLIINFNSIRIMKNIIHLGKIFVEVENKDYSQDEYKKTNKEIQSKTDENIKLYLSNLIEKLSTNVVKVPVNFIFIGDENFDNFSNQERIFYGSWGVNLLNSNNFFNDFSTIKNSPVFDLENDIIRGDGHPNYIGHEKIAKSILNSNDENSFLNFVEKACQSNDY